MTPRELAHELRNPLAQILIWEQVARLTDDPDVRARALTAIRECALEQNALIDRLLPRTR